MTERAHDPSADSVDVLNEACGPGVTWTRVNVAEAFPGVPTPLTWRWAGTTSDELVRKAWVSMGVFPRSYAQRPGAADDRMVVIQSGRALLNLDRLRIVGDSMPGNSGDKLEESLFGSSREHIPNNPTRRRYPVIAWSLPRAVVRARRELLRRAPVTAAWWLASTRPEALDSADAARRLLVESGRRYVEIGIHQSVGTIAGQGLFDTLGGLCAKAGLAGSEGLLVTADEPAELHTVADLWRLSRGDLTLAAFLDRHGYHAPVQGELSIPSWREDPSPVTALMSTYAEKDADADPLTRQQRRLAARAEAEAALFDALSPVRRPLARTLVRMARAYVPLREVARMQFLQCYDVARAAASRLGRDLVDRNVIDQPDDVHYLTVDEVLDPPRRLADAVTVRRERRTFYEAHTVPTLFTGQPPLQAIDEPEYRDRITGIAASGGVVEGRARVILDLDDSEGLAEGEILVAETTNPSWASFFLIASGVVVDIGGMLSHGAIVAREMGIPCVMHTVDARRTIRTGDLIRVDGDHGIVEILQRASEAPEPVAAP